MVQVPGSYSIQPNPFINEDVAYLSERLGKGRGEAKECGPGCKDFKNRLVSTFPHGVTYSDPGIGLSFGDSSTSSKSLLHSPFFSHGPSQSTARDWMRLRYAWSRWSSHSGVRLKSRRGIKKWDTLFLTGRLFYLPPPRNRFKGNNLRVSWGPPMSNGFHVGRGSCEWNGGPRKRKKWTAQT